jgi:hypothetical protein
LARELQKRLRRGVIISGSAIVFALFLLSPMAQASGSGTFNYERVYFNNSNGEVYIERAPRLIYNPNAPPDSYERNGIDWYANLYSYNSGCAADKCVPSVFVLTLYIADLDNCGRLCPLSNEWQVGRFWPVSVNEYGTSVSWSFTVEGAGETFSGSISATVSGTTAHLFQTDYVPTFVGGDNFSKYRIGVLNIDIAEQPGWNQVYLSGGIQLTIRNGNGYKDANHRFQLYTQWDVSWRGCGSLACWGSEYWYGTQMVHGDNAGVGDGYIYVRTGTSSGS